MGKVSLTVRQIMNLGLWDKVCEYKDWNPYILNEGQIDESEVVEFDDTFEKPEAKKIWYVLAQSAVGTHKMRFREEMNKQEAVKVGLDYCEDAKLEFEGVYDQEEINEAEEELFGEVRCK